MRIYLRLLRLAKPYWKALSAAFVCALGLSGITALKAWLVQPVMDGIFVRQDTTLLVPLSLAVLGIFLFSGFFTYGNAYLMQYVGNRVVKDLRERLFRHLIFLPVGYYARHSSGGLMARVLSDVQMIQRVATTNLKDLVQQGLTVVGLVAFVLSFRLWDLTLLALIVLPLTIVPLARLGQRLRRISRRGQEKMADLATILSETFTGIRMVKAFGMERFETDRFRQENDRFFRLVMKSTRTAEAVSPIMEVAGGIGTAFVIWFGGMQVAQGTISVGTFFSFMAALMLLYTPIRRLSRVQADLQQALGAAERIFEVLALASEEEDWKGKLVLGPIRQGIEFRGVGFRYEGRKRYALQQIDLRIRQGEVVALVGPSGSGKTTLVNLLPRFYDPTEGAILIDGVHIREVTLASLRAKIGIVTQDVILFHDTVRSNIAYGRWGASEEEIEAAARAAFAQEFIQEMPLGYDTVIGEKGIRLSGGQKQRLAIARALLKNPPILILDEATSALDTESERMVQQALANLMKDRTTFVIAHRLSTIRGADRILLLHEGRLVEEGTHESLMARGGLYRRLYLMQFADQEEVIQ